MFDYIDEAWGLVEDGKVDEKLVFNDATIYYVFLDHVHAYGARVWTIRETGKNYGEVYPNKSEYRKALLTDSAALSAEMEADPPVYCEDCMPYAPDVGERWWKGEECHRCHATNYHDPECVCEDCTNNWDLD